ncbi:UNVERIFIED_CONTAM: SAG-related sequence SRS31B [Hammondia hammondi]|eukprot:XP_008882588.1 SAG-related sequence SRS31B [Hammondia hammondi]
MERKTSFAGWARRASGLFSLLFVACMCALSWATEDTPTQITPKCSASEKSTTCVCGDTTAAVSETELPAGASLTVSRGTVSVTCPEKYKFVPEGKGKVCSVGSPPVSLEACSTSTKDITELLNPAPTPAPQWVETVNGAGKTHSLTLPPANFPSTDKKFFVGCLEPAEAGPSKAKAAQAKTTCVVNVEVAAKKSTLKDNVLTCAYGKESNNKTLLATLSSDSNTLTVDCGSEGQLQPSSESPFSAILCDAEDCTVVVNLTDVFLNFDESWLTVDKETGAAKLVVPKGGFPEKNKTIMLGCSLKNAPSGSRQDPDTTTVEKPTCNVKVAISAASTSAASAASSPLCAFSWGLISLFFSGAYLTSF